MAFTLKKEGVKALFFSKLDMRNSIQQDHDIAKLFENFQKVAKVINVNVDELKKRDETFIKTLDNHGKRINELFKITNDLLELFLELRKEDSEK